MTKEEAIKILSPNSESRLVRAADGFLPAQKVLCALEMAVTAIHAQQTPAKLGRSRWEGCRFCGGGEVAEFLPRKKQSHCPYCGRHLTEEAWAELERRISGGTTD